MPETFPSITPQIAIAFILVVVMVIGTGVSIFASRIHIIVGIALEFFSRGFCAIAWLAYVFLVFPQFNKFIQEFGFIETPGLLLLKHAFYIWPMTVAVLFFAVIFNTAIFGLVLAFNKNAATGWSSFVSVLVLTCCLLTIFIILGSHLRLQQGIGMW